MTVVPAIDADDDVGGLVRSSLSRLSSVVTTRAIHSPFIAKSGDSSSVAALHLVVLQHGFLGCGGDMGLLKNAIRTELPSHVEVFIPTSNEGKEGDSIAQMGARLAVELMEFCRTTAPSLLELDGQARVSFIGHSLGGVVIRWALQVQLDHSPHTHSHSVTLSSVLIHAMQEPMIRPLLRNVHAFISLASPHVGTLFPESQLVSVGMWALFQFKKYKSLQVRATSRADRSKLDALTEMLCVRVLLVCSCTVGAGLGGRSGRTALRVAALQAVPERGPAAFREGRVREFTRRQIRPFLFGEGTEGTYCKLSWSV